MTIRKLDEAVKHKLRPRAAMHRTSMEAEAREILRKAVEEDESSMPPRTREGLRQRLQGVPGLRKERGTSDEFRNLTRWVN